MSCWNSCYTPCNTPYYNPCYNTCYNPCYTTCYNPCNSCCYTTIVTIVYGNNVITSSLTATGYTGTVTSSGGQLTKTGARTSTITLKGKVNSSSVTIKNLKLSNGNSKADNGVTATVTSQNCCGSTRYYTITISN